VIIHPGWPPGVQAFRERCPAHALQWTRTWAGDGRLALYAGQSCRKLIGQNVLSAHGHAAKRKARLRPELMSRLSRVEIRGRKWASRVTTYQAACANVRTEVLNEERQRLHHFM
jgi:hypothetical protein